MSKYVGFRLGKVHESHVISEYYCGVCGYPVTDHDSFCPECGGAFRECDASNLEDENAKLRELVRDMLPFAKDSLGIECPTERCWLYKEGECDKPFVLCRVEELTRKRVRDLGIEDG